MALLQLGPISGMHYVYDRVEGKKKGPSLGILLHRPTNTHPPAHKKGVLVLACRYHANISVPNKLVQDSATLE
jgi:hypothetical protein